MIIQSGISGSFKKKSWTSTINLEKLIYLKVVVTGAT
jgi:hypothetical protein